MPSATQNTSIADYYFGLLENLNSNIELDLISKLSLSIKEENTAEENSLQSLFVSFKFEKTAEAIIEGFTNFRMFN